MVFVAYLRGASYLVTWWRTYHREALLILGIAEPVSGTHGEMYPTFDGTFWDFYFYVVCGTHFYKMSGAALCSTPLFLRLFSRWHLLRANWPCPSRRKDRLRAAETTSRDNFFVKMSPCNIFLGLYPTKMTIFAAEPNYSKVDLTEPPSNISSVKRVSERKLEDIRSWLPSAHHPLAWGNWHVTVLRFVSWKQLECLSRGTWWIKEHAMVRRRFTWNLPSLSETFDLRQIEQGINSGNGLLSDERSSNIPSSWRLQETFFLWVVRDVLETFWLEWSARDWAFLRCQRWQLNHSSFFEDGKWKEDHAISWGHNIVLKVSVCWAIDSNLRQKGDEWALWKLENSIRSKHNPGVKVSARESRKNLWGKLLW